MSGRKSKPRAHGARVTATERQVMFWAARTGKNYKDIGNFLGVSGNCVQHHVVRMETEEALAALHSEGPSLAPLPLGGCLLEVGG